MYSRTRLITFTTIFFVIVSALVFNFSCIKDKCGNLICQNSGICVGGKCSCKRGYEGDLCERKWNDKFVGTWHNEEYFARDTVSTHRKFDWSITSRFTLDSFYIDDFADSINSVLCTRTANRTFNIQSVQITDNLKISGGNGTMDSITGNISGSYFFVKKLSNKDTVVTVYFSCSK
ncbi:MAG: hypothetical protein JST82_10630 [Bacteroidetes bacterium]|nr:hypothetical protein [Bacteroidota bacterium]